MELTTEQQAAVAKLFLEARTARKLRQEDVAALTGVGRTKIGELERAFSPNVRFIDVARLARFYKLNMDDIAKLLGI